MLNLMQKYPILTVMLFAILMMTIRAGGLTAHDRLVMRPARLAAEKQATEMKARAEAEFTQAVQLTGAGGDAQIILLSNGSYVIAGRHVKDACELYRTFDWELQPDGAWVVWEKKYFQTRYNTYPAPVREIVLNRPPKTS